MKDKYLVRFDLIKCDGSIAYGEQSFTLAESEKQAERNARYRARTQGTAINIEAFNLADEYRQ